MIQLLEVLPSRTPPLPYAVDTFVKAINAADLEGLVCCFAEDALFNDQLSEYSGKREIVDWAMRDIIAENLARFVLREVTSFNNSNLTVEVDGDFDKGGLPEPLVLNFNVTIFETKIVQLIMLRNQNYL